MDIIKSTSIDAGESEANSKVKPEPITEEEKTKHLVSDFIKGAMGTMRKYSDYLLEEKGWATQCGTLQYGNELGDDISTHVTKVQKSIRLLESVATGGKYNEEAIPELMKSLDAIQKKHNELREHCARFGIVVKGTSGGVKRVKKAK